MDGYSRRMARTSDIDEARRSMDDLYRTPMALTADPTRDFRYEMAVATETGFAAAALRFGASCRSGTNAFPDVMVAHAVSGRHRWRVGSESGPGSVPFIVPPDREMRVEFSNSHIRTIGIDPALLRKVAQSLTGAEPGPLRLDGVNSDARHHALVTEALRFAEATLVGNAGLRDAPLARTQIVQQTIVSILTAYPIIELAARRADAAPRAVRRAVAFMEEHAREPITMTDVALAAGVSTRALQSAFQRRFEMTPSHYLRRLRLRSVHAELRNGFGPHASVRDIARRWGFVHAGRFARLYADEYGERPSDTLRR
ncbi:helix-turn-helix transcriptional regulator [Microbacterium sp. B2969]|uniref:Helix-turn-helix transcriptional regulator n=1 Tax=Microbacterium alkaliflavum TaxID=3248839 RepID=A0ABW7QAF4_9MICO